jgi:hypothetical protein
MVNRPRLEFFGAVSLMTLLGFGFVVYKTGVQYKKCQHALPVVQTLLTGGNFVSGTPWDGYDERNLMLQYLMDYKKQGYKKESNFVDLTFTRNHLQERGFAVFELEEELMMLTVEYDSYVKHYKVQPVIKELTRLVSGGRWSIGGQFSHLHELIFSDYSS